MEKIKRFLQAFTKNEKIFVPIILLIFSVLLCVPLYHGGYNIGHDSSYHLVSIAGLADSNEGKIFSGMWNNIGYGEGIFYPQLSHYVGVAVYKVVSIFGFSVLTAAKITNVLLLYCSGLTFYLFVRQVLGKKAMKGNIIASLLYIGATYHMSCILIRDAMAETALYVFIPIVALSLYYLVKQDYKKFLLSFVIGVAGCMNSHLVLTIWLVIFCVLFAIYKRKLFFTKKNILYVVLGSVITLTLTCSYWAYMIICKGACDYFAFSDEMITNAFKLSHRELRLLFTPSVSADSIRFFLDLTALLFCIIMAFFTKYIDKKYRGIVKFNLVLIAIIALLTAGIIPIEKWPHLLSAIQFAWRLVTYAVFLLAFSLAICLYYMPQNNRKWLMLLLAASIFTNAYSIEVYPMTFEHLRQASTINADYLPTKMLDHYRDGLKYSVDTRRLEIIPKEGKAVVKNARGDTPDFDFDLETESSTKVSIPRVYYYGYEAIAEYSDGSVEKIAADCDEYGFVALEIPRSAHVAVRYTGGKALALLRAISAGTAVGFFGGYLVSYARKKHTKTQK